MNLANVCSDSAEGGIRQNKQTDASERENLNGWISLVLIFDPAFDICIR